jgi:hypothetical protein
MNNDKITENELINDIETASNIKIPDIESQGYLYSFETDTSQKITKSEKDVKKIKSLQIQRNYGNLKCVFLGFKNPLILIGPDWLNFIGLISFYSITFVLVFICLGRYLGFFKKLIGYIIYIIYASSYIYTALGDPGMPSIKYESICVTEPDRFNRCSHCGCLTDLEAEFITYHCFSCGVCIEGFDHHCPWTSKCIGKRSILSFYIFVFSSIIYIPYLIYIIILFYFSKINATS